MQPNHRGDCKAQGTSKPTQRYAGVRSHYYDTHAPVVTWFAIRLMIVFSILFNRAMRQIDFVMAYPQAPIEMDMYMELPQGINTKQGNSKDHVLKLLQNIYGQKQAGCVWNHHLTANSQTVGGLIHPIPN